MNHTDPVLTRLSELRRVEPKAELTARIRAAALSKLELRRVHAVWSWAVVASVMCYLLWAVHFVAVIKGLPTAHGHYLLQVSVTHQYLRYPILQQRRHAPLT